MKDGGSSITLDTRLIPLSVSIFSIQSSRSRRHSRCSTAPTPSPRRAACGAGSAVAARVFDMREASRGEHLVSGQQPVNFALFRCSDSIAIVSSLLCTPASAHLCARATPTVFCPLPLPSVHHFCTCWRMPSPHACTSRLHSDCSMPACAALAVAVHRRIHCSASPRSSCYCSTRTGRAAGMYPLHLQPGTLSRASGLRADSRWIELSSQALL